MASNRHLGRIVALQSVYEYATRYEACDTGLDAKGVVEKNIERYESQIDDKEFVYNLVQGVADKTDVLDPKLQVLAPEWPLSQISKIDHAVLRIGLYELLYLKDEVPPRVAINEAVELAKAFGSDSSSKFVNGVLGSAYRTFLEEDQKDDSAKV